MGASKGKGKSPHTRNTDGAKERVRETNATATTAMPNGKTQDEDRERRGKKHRLVYSLYISEKIKSRQ